MKRTLALSLAFRTKVPFGTKMPLGASGDVTGKVFVLRAFRLQHDW